jgi:heme-degrading monooxygenase HmoA
MAAAFRQLPGFESFMSGTDRASGRVIVVSTWDTEEHARFSRDALGGVVQSRRQASACSWTHLSTTR